MSNQKAVVIGDDVSVIDYYDKSPFEYQFRPSGDLEFLDAAGRWRRVRGCSGANVLDFSEFVEELDSVTETLTKAFSLTPPELYLRSELERFRYLVNECLAFNGIELQWFQPRMLSWLLFNRIEEVDEKPCCIRAALRVLNRLPEARYSAGGGSAKIEQRADWFALIATYCDGDLDRGFALAQAMGARDLAVSMDALGYFRLDAKKRHERDVEIWAAAERAKAKARGQAAQGQRRRSVRPQPAPGAAVPKIGISPLGPKPKASAQAETEGGTDAPN